MKPWNFHNPVAITFGQDTLAELPRLCTGKRVLLVTTRGTMQRGLGPRVCAMLADRIIEVMDAVETNPDLFATQSIADALRKFAPDEIIALGGGSSLDTAKALSVCLAAPAGWTLQSYIIDQTAPAPTTAIPIVAIPTTAGTGSEVTPFATLWDHARKKKLSLASPSVFPRSAIIDWHLLAGTPINTLISCGLDALSQALESVWNKNSQPVTRLMAARAVPMAIQALPGLMHTIPSPGALAQISEASLLAGFCISQTRTALAHSMSYPLTARFGIPHGLACGFTLPSLLRFNLAHDPDGSLAAFTGECGIDDLPSALSQLMGSLSVAEMLRSHLPNPAEALKFCHEMLTPGRADNNAAPVTTSDVEAILRDSFEGLGIALN